MSPTSRTVRVFLCSTCRDMRAEREYLHTKIFPKITAFYKTRGVTFEVVDLGWNVAEDQAEGFDQLKHSLDEVEKCRPFFIGLVGQRYGRGLTQIRRDLDMAYPWILKETKGTSRMHLEMLHGVLNQSTSVGGSFFYVRSPDFLKQVPIKEECRFLLSDSPGEDNRRTELVKALRASGRPIRDYSCTWDVAQKQLTGLEPLGRLIAEDLERGIHEHLFSRDTFCPTLVELIVELMSVLSLPVPSPSPLTEYLSVIPARVREELRRPENQPTLPPTKVDENVQFTVLRPKVVQPDKWYDLLAIAHLAERRPDAPKDEPEPLEQVKTIIKQRLGARAKDYENIKQDSTAAIPRQGEITFVPEVPNVVFNPPRRSFLWLESVHPEEFRLMASSQLDGQTARGRLTVFLGAIIVADVPLVFRVDSNHPPTPTKEQEEACSAQPYRKIFASYSHKDLPIVEQYEQFAQSMGDEVLRDWKHLRAGEMWNDKLMRMIESADVFQLFWSRNSMTSGFVRQEYEHALGLNRANFIRPTYWEDPMPTSESPQLPPPALAQLHFQRIGTGLLSVPSHPKVLPESEFELTLDDSGVNLGSVGTPAKEEKDIFETDFEVPALEDDSGSEAVVIKDSETDMESSDFNLALDDSDSTPEDESGSQVVALDDEGGVDEEAETVSKLPPKAKPGGSAIEEEESGDVEDLLGVGEDSDSEDMVTEDNKDAKARSTTWGRARARLAYAPKRGGEMNWLAVLIGIILLIVVAGLVVAFVFPDTLQQLLKSLGF